MALPAPSRFDRIGYAGARAELRCGIRIGVLCGLTHRGQAPELNIYAELIDQVIDSENKIAVRQKEFFLGTLIIGEQFDAVTGGPAIWATDDVTTGFGVEAKPITVGDKIQWPANSGRFYFVKDPIICTDNGHTYFVKIEDCKPLSLGQRS